LEQIQQYGHEAIQKSDRSRRFDAAISMGISTPQELWISGSAKWKLSAFSLISTTSTITTTDGIAQ
jgi:hypothetical protein